MALVQCPVRFSKKDEYAPGAMLMRSISFIPALLLVSALAGCASLHRASPPDVQARFDDAVIRYGYGDLAGATRELAWVDRQCTGRALGQQAALALAALHLDGRNPGRHVDTAAQLARSFLHSADADDWRRPIATTLYLTALDLGASMPDSTTLAADNSTTGRAPAAPQHTDVPGCGPVQPLPNDAAVPTLPVLPGEPLIARLRAVRADRAQLAATVDSLCTALDNVRLELVAKDKELQRIRKTLKP
ncbi:MAG: hypothetical protein P8099_00200 [Gemmatimonadota bacterium]